MARTFNVAGLASGDTIDIEGANSDTPSHYATVLRISYGGAPATTITLPAENSQWYRAKRIAKSANSTGTGRTVSIAGSPTQSAIVLATMSGIIDGDPPMTIVDKSPNVSGASWNSETGELTVSFNGVFDDFDSSYFAVAFFYFGGFTGALLPSVMTPTSVTLSAGGPIDQPLPYTFAFFAAT